MRCIAGDNSFGAYQAQTLAVERAPVQAAKHKRSVALGPAQAAGRKQFVEAARVVGRKRPVALKRVAGLGPPVARAVRLETVE